MFQRAMPGPVALQAAAVAFQWRKRKPSCWSPSAVASLWSFLRALARRGMSGKQEQLSTRLLMLPLGAATQCLLTQYWRRPKRSSWSYSRAASWFLCDVDAELRGGNCWAAAAVFLRVWRMLL